ncbi:MAG TPA: Uma2 family endonuclease [Saprospiraceae bacterium]|nr:Uma2 family endonuclease [Saprospiraceae bacterium]
MGQEKTMVERIMTMPSATRIATQLSEQLAAERERRNQFYNDISEYEKAEFINGEVIIHSPVRKEHNDVTGALFSLMKLYVQKNQRGYVGYEKLMIALTRNDYEPDLCYFNQEKARQFQPGQTLFPAPDLAVEVLSKSTATNDRGIKFQDYQDHGVQEYWLIDADEQYVEQYRLDEQDEYQLILKAKAGMITCSAIEGFSIPIEAIFDEQKNLEALQKLLE